jgi:hypothetical protein
VVDRGIPKWECDRTNIFEVYIKEKGVGALVARRLKAVEVDGDVEK